MAEEVVAFSTTRKGGVSKGNYGELNLNEFSGDNAQDVLTNRRLMAERLGIVATHLIIPHQVHGTDVRLISNDFFALSNQKKTAFLDKVDGVMTNQKGVCVGVSTADCIPVLLYDTKQHAVAAVHAGWRGTVAKIVCRALADMHAAFGTNPSDIKAVIGPGISLKNFEVGQEVYDAFAQAGFDMSEIAVMKEKWHIDLPRCNRLQLMHLGVKEDHIQMSSVCTYDQSNEYFSARRLGIDSGRIYTAIMLK